MNSRKKHSFRNYQANSTVENTYKKMHENQTLFFVKNKKRAYCSGDGYTDVSGNKIRKRFMDVFPELDKIIDESDPDTGLPQIYHAYQTAEALKQYCDPENPVTLRTNIPIRDLFSEAEWTALPAVWQKKFAGCLHELYSHIQDWTWLPLTGFLHDLGKVLATQSWGALPQWAVVGDTFPVGEPFSPANVYSESNFYKKNSSLTANSIYKRHMGLEQLEMSFGHDEYLYAVLSRTPNHLPKEALYLIRFHSFYPWHSPRGNERGYTELASYDDWMLLPLLKAFQKSDLYSKQATLPNISELKNHYSELIERFVPGRESASHHLRPAKVLW